MGAAVERSAIPAAAAAALFGALFFSNGSGDSPLLWFGGGALAAAALAAAAVGAGLLPAPRLDAAAWTALGSLLGLGVWCGLSIVWSMQPDQSWSFTNRTLVYAGFALLGVGAATVVSRATIADGLGALLGLLYGWALLAKVVPSLYPDYGRIARLRAPVGYWNGLAVLGVAGAALAVEIASRRGRSPLARAAGVLLLYAATIVTLLTYSRANLVLLVALGAVWLALEPARRLESVAAIGLGALPALAAFGVALALPGITDNGVTRAQRAHDGWIFAVAVIAVGAAAAAAAFLAARRAEQRPPGPSTREQADRIVRLLLAAVAVSAVVLAVVFAGRIWHEFRSTTQVGSGSSRFGTLASGNRWGWWQQAWHAFVRHPGGGTGAGTFALTNTLHRTDPYSVATAPHNVPLQFLSETGVPGLLLYLGVAGGVAAAAVRARRRTGDAVVTAIGLALAAWWLHMIVDIDWRYAAVCAPLAFAAGTLLPTGSSGRVAVRRPVLAAGAALLAAACVYSLAAPWLAHREVNLSIAAISAGNLDAAYSHAQRAHSWNPISLEALEQLAVTAPTVREQARRYQEATRLEPLNPDTWYELGAFAWYRLHDAQAAYKALDRSWGLDRVDGPLAQRCSILDLARREALGYGIICPGSG